jgi:hypothetical protein
MWLKEALSETEEVESQLKAKGLSKEEIRGLLEEIEAELSQRFCFTFDDAGYATLEVCGQKYLAGRFETPSIAALKARANTRNTEARPKLLVISGRSALMDIGALQAISGQGSLFQVASQFNCLEAPSAQIAKVSEYVYDSTQGPRASISAFPGTFLRHYCAPDGKGGRFVQSDKKQLNLLSDVVQMPVAEVENGYLTGNNIYRPKELAQKLVEHFDEIRIGVHERVQVALGYEWGGPVIEVSRASVREKSWFRSLFSAKESTLSFAHARGPARNTPESAPIKTISQIFTSTIAFGEYGPNDGSKDVETISRQLLRASYLGTLLAAIDLNCKTVLLTLIGGGVFLNSPTIIWESILWALNEVRGDFWVILNARSLSGDVKEIIQKSLLEIGGEYLEV